MRPTSCAQSIEEFNRVAAQQTAQIVRLTRYFVVLTAAMVIGLVVQIVTTIG